MGRVGRFVCYFLRIDMFSEASLGVEGVYTSLVVLSKVEHIPVDRLRFERANRLLRYVLRVGCLSIDGRG